MPLIDMKTSFSVSQTSYFPTSVSYSMFIFCHRVLNLRIYTFFAAEFADTPTVNVKLRKIMTLYHGDVSLLETPVLAVAGELNFDGDHEGTFLFVLYGCHFEVFCLRTHEYTIVFFLLYCIVLFCNLWRTQKTISVWAVCW